MYLCSWLRSVEVDEPAEVEHSVGGKGGQFRGCFVFTLADQRFHVRIGGYACGEPQKYAKYDFGLVSAFAVWLFESWLPE